MPSAVRQTTLDYPPSLAFGEVTIVQGHSDTILVGQSCPNVKHVMLYKTLSTPVLPEIIDALALTLVSHRSRVPCRDSVSTIFLDHYYSTLADSTTTFKKIRDRKPVLFEFGEEVVNANER